MKRLLPLLLLVSFISAKAQQDNLTTTPANSDDRLHALEERSAKTDMLLNVLRDFRIQAYMQTEWQRADTAGVQSFAGGNFPNAARNRFLIRRGRFKLSWMHDIVNKKGDTIKVGEFAFQFDATEKGFNAIKDFYGRIVDPWTGWFSLQGGIFLRPFGYETPASPAVHESPEFSRMNQTIMPNECELGEALIIESPKSFKPVYLRVDASLVNGEGIGVGSETGTYQNAKDFIGRVVVGKVFKVNDGFKVGFNASGSFYNGGVLQTTNNVFEVQTIGGVPTFKNITGGTSDTSGKLRTTYKRQYYGAHLQVNFDYKVTGNFNMSTMLRGEFIAGQQPGQTGATLISSQVPTGVGNAVPGVDLYMRKFNGMIAYFTEGFHWKAGKQQSMMHSEITVKYDFYDPNTAVNGTEILKTNGFNVTDLRTNTLGLGYTFSPVNYFKLMIWYDHVMLENSGLANLPTTLTHMDVLTIRTQFMIDTWWFNKRSTSNKNLL